MSGIKILLAAGLMTMLAVTACRQQQKNRPQPITGSSVVNLHMVLQPVNSSVIAAVNAVTPQVKEVITTIPAEGYLDFDTRTYNNIAARFSGRIEKLYIKSAFQDIHRGERVFDIYSPDMVTAQQDLLFLLKNSPQESVLIDAAKQKLLLLGVTSAQISQVIRHRTPFYSLPVYSPYEGHVHDVAHSQMSGNAGVKPQPDFSSDIPLSVKEGMYVEKGQTIFYVVNPHHLWAILKVDPAYVAKLKLNEPVTLSLPDMPTISIKGEVNFIEPFLSDGDKRTSVRVYIDNMEHNLKVNSLIKATIASGRVNGLWIPRTALLYLGRTQIVWLKKGGFYQAHQVNTGAITGNEVQITRGLTVADSIAGNAQYLADSENFIKI
ncbi:MAG: rane fusion protein copper/silver efflux system [Mucilaginibacter sp.]|nr:rane fusion protein copper/silver efflux system [Mucilaginibacter sp.]